MLNRLGFVHEVGNVFSTSVIERKTRNSPSISEDQYLKSFSLFQTCHLISLLIMFSFPKGCEDNGPTAQILLP